MFNEYPDIVNVSELCKMLQIGKNKAYNLLNSNIIKHIKIGKVYKIPKIWIIDYLCKQ